MRNLFRNVYKHEVHEFFNKLWQILESFVPSVYKTNHSKKWVRMFLPQGLHITIFDFLETFNNMDISFLFFFFFSNRTI